MCVKIKTNAVKTALPLVLKFYSALTCEKRSGDAFLSLYRNACCCWAHGVPLVLEFHPALTYERFCDSFSLLVGGITVETAPDIPLVFLWTLCKVLNAQQSVFTRQYSAERSGDLFRSFAAKDSRTSLLIKRHAYRSLIRTCFHLVQKILPVLIWKRDK